MGDVTEQTFDTAVIDRSSEVPVVVDLWAEWCGPCRKLGPVLERVVAETGGKVELAKIDVDANPTVAQALGVQSIPAVFGIVDGQIVGSFLGAQPEDVVRDFVNTLAGAGAAAETPVDRLVAAGDERSLREALELEPANEKAIVALAALLVRMGDHEEAQTLLATMAETDESREVAAAARSAAAEAAGVGTEARLAELLETAPRSDAARKEFVELLDVLGPDHPRTTQWRRKLASRLY